MILYYLLCVFVFLKIVNLLLKPLRSVCNCIFDQLIPENNYIVDLHSYEMSKKELEILQEEIERKKYIPARNKLYLSDLDLSWRNNM